VIAVIRVFLCALRVIVFGICWICRGQSVSAVVSMGRGAVALWPGSRIRGRIGLWLFVPSVIVLFIAYGSLLLRTFETVLHGYVA
jgi:hypothetical protein